MNTISTKNIDGIKGTFKFFKLIEILIGDLLVSIVQLVLRTILCFPFLRKVIQRQGNIIFPRHVQTDCGARPGFY